MAAIAATTASVNAETFSDYFKLTYGDQVIENGQTVTDNTYHDEWADLGIPGWTRYVAEATIIATNVYDEAMDLAFVLSCVDNKTENFQLCYNYDNAPGNCLAAQNGSVTSPESLKSVDCEGYFQMDIHEVDITDFATPTLLKLDLYVTEGGEKLEGTDCTVYINFTHEMDTTAVEGIEVDAAPAEFYNLQGVKVAQPEKGGIYIVRQGEKVTKQLF